MTTRLIKIAGIIAGITLAATGMYFTSPPELTATAFAVGDLVIDWGVPSGDPIFTITDAAPGDTASEDVLVTNNAPVNRPLGARGEITDDTGIAPVLELVIAADGTPVYGTGSSTGPKTLANFITDSSSPVGIELLTLPPGDSTTLTFTLIFPDDAGNALQGASVTFNITLGITAVLPQACDDIVFSGPPIFGTAGRDRIRGTEGNDLIITFEGRDSVDGRGGDDCILGGDDRDILRGGPGNDVIDGGGGNDSIRGDSGNDTLLGGDGDDIIRGDGGNDFIDGGAGDDRMRGDSGDDVLIGGSGADRADGDSGHDTCEAERIRSCEA